VDINFSMDVVLHVIKYCASVRSDYVFVLIINTLMKYNTFILYYLKIYLFLFYGYWSLPEFLLTTRESLLKCHVS